MVKIDNYEVFNSLEKGRGLRATQNINFGEEILSEKPLVCTLTNSKCRGVRCDFCFAESEKLLKCSKCKFVSYCGKSCQSGDWSVHKRECKCLQKVSPKQPPDIVRLVSHLLYKYYWSKDETTNNNRSEIEQLKSNEEYITNLRKEAFFTFGAVLNEYISSSPVDLQSADVYSLFCKVSCNSFTITNDELNPIGTGVFKTASLINHSCNPNCFALFNGRQISIRSIKAIQAGEEIVVSYVDLLFPTSQRKVDLMDGFMFECTCEMCLGSHFNDSLMSSIKCDRESCTCMVSIVDDNVGFMGKACSCDQGCIVSKDVLQVASNCMDDLNALYIEIKVVPTEEQMNKLEKLIVKAEKLLGPSNLSLVHSYEVAMDGCLQREQWRKALQYAKKLEKTYQLYLTKYHPSIGLHHFKTGKLHSILNDLHDSYASLQKAQRILSVSHGNNHPLVETLDRTLAQLSFELVENEQYETMQRIANEE